MAGWVFFNCFFCLGFLGGLGRGGWNSCTSFMIVMKDEFWKRRIHCTFHYRDLIRLKWKGGRF